MEVAHGVAHAWRTARTHRRGRARSGLRDETRRGWSSRRPCAPSHERARQSPEADERRPGPAGARDRRSMLPSSPTGWVGQAEGAAGLPGGRRLEAGRGGAGAPTLRSREGPGRRGRGRFPQILGRWFTSGLASNSSWFREKKATLTMCTSVFTPTASGGLDLTTTFLRWDRGGPRAPARGRGLGAAWTWS